MTLPASTRRDGLSSVAETRSSTERQDARVAATQTTPNTPTGTVYSPTFYFLVTLLAVAISWLLSKL